jgi:hypothetical protein
MNTKLGCLPFLPTKQLLLSLARTKNYSTPNLNSPCPNLIAPVATLTLTLSPLLLSYFNNNNNNNNNYPNKAKN